ncbi:hypothetical protein LPJ59_002368 [Coemansia sp. RSA 2399]|nr:hypothetical protein LPJ59_002368 [Coemansia sp. RSA 2399]
MEHGDPHSLTSWRTWLLPSTLLAPGETHIPGYYSQPRSLVSTVGSTLGGPHMAHDFPPFLKRLWLYQSIISVSTATVLLPIGVLFEHTSRKESSLRRLLQASARWIMCVRLALCVWEAVCQRSGHLQALGFYRPFSTGGATLRYSVYHATCIFASLPVVLVIVPRGTWALFSWIKCCVGLKSELAHVARMRYRKLKHERTKIERRLQKAIGSWKWERIRDSDEAWVVDDFFDTDARHAPSLRSPPTSRSRNSISDLPPLHPGLSPTMDYSVEVRPYRTVAYRQTRISARPRIARGGGVLPGSAIFRPQEVAMDYAPSFQQSGAHKSPNLQSASMFLYQSDGSDSSEDGNYDSWANRATQRVQRQRQFERERAMKQLSRQIRKYHAQLVFIREEIKRLDESDILGVVNGDVSNTDNVGSKWTFKRSTLVTLVGRVTSILVTVTASLCWLLVVAQVGRGALCAIFVGEPDLTHSFTYFIPALSSDGIGGLDSTVAGSLHSGAGSGSGFSKRAGVDVVWKRALIPPLITLCQMVSSTLLFVVVMFGVLSIGSSVEDSIHPLRFLIMSYSGSLLRARQWEWLPYFLLPDSILVCIDPACVVAHFASSNQLGSVAGNTSRVFFSSSGDLTSFYRGLLRQAAGSSAMPTTLLPGGILPESFLQAKAWGKRVFLLFASNTKRSSNTEGDEASKEATIPRTPQPVSTKQLVAYTWIVCGLAMTWPSVLRTTGLISERAYVLPIASLVQPLWVPYRNEQEFVVAAVDIPVHGAAAAAADIDDGIVGLYPNAEALVNGVATDKCSLGICLTGDTADSSLLYMVNDRTLFCDNQQQSFYFGTAFNVSDNSPDASRNGVYTSPAHEPLESVSASNEDADTMSMSTNDPASASAPISAIPKLAFGRKISRRQLRQSLSADTLRGNLVRWSVRLACKVTSHTCISAGYIAWWVSPDLIVPLSPTTVDMQLGYLQPLASSSYPALVSSSAGYSEWFGMLRRLERGSVWLPHADDGTPLRLQRPISTDGRKHSGRERQAPNSSGNGAKAAAKRGWIQMAFASAVHGLGVVGLGIKELLYALIQRLWSAALLCTRVATSSVVDCVHDTRAGAAIGAVVNAASGIASAVGYNANSIWETVLSPLWHYMSLGGSALFGCVSLAASVVTSVIGSISLPNKDAAAAQVGVTSVAPPLFIHEYWDSAALRGSSPALQRLRPELWPHVFGGGSDSVVVLYDVAPPQQQQQQQPVAASVRKDAGFINAKPMTAKQSREGASAVSTFGASQQEHHSATAQAATEPGEEGAARPQQNRKAWTTLDWLLAAYRVALSIIALRTVLRPSRLSRMFIF